MGGEYVLTEVAAGAAQHRVRMIAVVLDVVVLDQQVIALDPVVMPGAATRRPFPGEMQVARAEPVRLASGELAAETVQVHGDKLLKQRPCDRSELAGGDATRR